LIPMDTLQFSSPAGNRRYPVIHLGVCGFCLGCWELGGLRTSTRVCAPPRHVGEAHRRGPREL
jgi:hypothetical protein